MICVEGLGLEYIVMEELESWRGVSAGGAGRSTCQLHTVLFVL
jgi:hypothetical protein